MVVGLYVRRHLDNIEAALIESYPHRSNLLWEAFGAHRECKYSLSIQAFLTQSDGIFYERFGKLLFSEKGKDAVNAFSSEVRGHFFQASCTLSRQTFRYGRIREVWTTHSKALIGIRLSME